MKYLQVEMTLFLDRMAFPLLPSTVQMFPSRTAATWKACP